MNYLKQVVLLAAIGACLIAPAAAESHDKCYHNAEAYDEGERVGETVCKGGAWVDS